MPPDILRRIQHAVDSQGAVQRTDPVEDADFHDVQIARREPVYEPRATIEFPMPDTHGTDKVIGPRQNDAGYRIAYPQRVEQIVGRFKRSASVVLDGTGNGIAEFTNVVPTNQTWLLDRLIGRVQGAGATGVCMLYEGTTTNDDGILATVNLAGALNVGQQDGNPVEIQSGARLFAVFATAGAGLTATARIFYRVVEYVPGQALGESVAD